MKQENTNENVKKSLEDMTIKEALKDDVAQVMLRNHVIMDPYVPPIPITPVVIGKKIIKGAKNLFKQKWSKHRN